MTICNMAIECGAKSGLISPDETTFEFLRNRKYAPKDFDKAVEEWKQLASDLDAQYDTAVEIDISDMKPVVTWGTNPEQSISIDETLPIANEIDDPAKQLAAEKAYEYVQLTPGKKIVGTPIDYVFIGSCTNGRIEDMRAAAKILEGKKVHEDVTCFIVPGSESVRAKCIEEGLDQIFQEAGADFRQPGCSMCLAMNGDMVPAGKRCASTSNRNFVGRQGVGSYTHLMSPMMAAMCAVRGEIIDPEGF